MTKASDLFIQCLEEEGVEYIFGVPGEENLDFLDSLSRSTKIKLVLTRHEQGAGFMAATYGRHTGQTGVCLATLGPGATNFVTASAYAQLGGMPMMMITGQKPIKKSKQGRFQILDVVDMMRPITKYTHQLASADNIPSRVREAIRLAEEEKPGAVHLEFPEDIAEEQTESRPLKRSLCRRPLADEKAVRAAVRKIEQARSPVLVIGAGANRKMTSRMLLQFIEKTGIPFITTQLGKGVIDELHPKFLGCAALSAGDFVHKAIEAADLIINVGHDVIEKPPFFMMQGGTEVIHVSTRTAEVDPVYFPQIEVIGDIANAMWQIKEDIVPSGTWNFDKHAARARRPSSSTPPALCDDMRFPIFPSLPGQADPRSDAGRRHHLPRQRRLQDLVRAQLSGAPAEHRAARQCAGDDGRRPALGDGLGDDLSGPQGDGDLRRRRLHDEQPGDGDRGPPRPQPHRPDPARQRLWHDPLEAGQHGLCRLGPDLRQSRLRQICREPMAPAATASTAPRGSPACSRSAWIRRAST